MRHDPIAPSVMDAAAALANAADRHAAERAEIDRLEADWRARVAENQLAHIARREAEEMAS